METVTYDRLGRMDYNPEFHHNHCTKFTEADLEYMCKFYEVDPIQRLSMALGRTEKTIRNRVRELRVKGKYEYYKNLNKHW